jgi:hypothetical protein
LVCGDRDKEMTIQALSDLKECVCTLTEMAVLNEGDALRYGRTVKKIKGFLGFC